RFGGDEFVVFVFNLLSVEEVAAVVEKIIAVTTGLYELDGDQVHIDISAGVATAGIDQCDISVMHVNAELAPYQDKSEQGTQWALFASTMETKYRSRQKLKADLRQAIDRSEIKVVYQPIMSAQSLRVVAYEALARWDHAELGSVSPTEFIPLA